MELLVDSSVWIDFFNGTASPHADYLNGQLGRRLIVTGDLILAEVLQGFRKAKDYAAARNALLSFPILNMVGPEIALKSSNNYRFLREKGITMRTTIDSLIATFCIESHIELLHSDGDFDPFERFLGLRVLHP